jgi:pilus assembly protein CpaD
MITRNAFRLASLLAVLVAGSCEAPTEAPPAVFEDGAANHPITAEPVYRSLKLPATQILSNGDTAELVAFVDAYLARGNGAISVAVPEGPNSSQLITALGERLADLGVPRSRILVGVQDQAASDARVEIGYVSFEAHTDPCGDWSENAAATFENRPMPNFGCSVQHNIAAQLADPRDLTQPRGASSADAVQRMQMFNKYEQGQATASQKTQDQSGAISSVGSGSQ